MDNDARRCKHRRLVRLGSHEAQSANLPPGFQDAAELFHWPDRVVKVLQEKAPNKLRNISALAQRGGIDLFSFMAGNGTCGSALTHINRALEKHNLVPAGTKKSFVCAAALDEAKHCLHVLCSMQNGPEKIYPHVFGSLSSRISDEVRTTIENLKHARGSCDNSEASHTWVDCLQDYLTAATDDGIYFAPSGAAFCHQCQQLCPVHQKKKRFTLVIAGTPCVDFASYGKQKGMDGDNMEQFLMFVAELKVLKPHLVLLENSEYKTRDLHQSCADALGMMMTTGIDNPTMWSVPVKRPRRYSWLWDPTTFNCDATFDQYISFFNCSMAMTGPDLFLATEAERQAYMRHLAAAHGEIFSKDKQLEPDDVLSIEEQTRIKEHFRDHYRQYSGPNGSYVTGIEQKLAFASFGCEIPSLTKNAKVLSLKYAENPIIATPAEHSFFQGEPLAIASTNDDYPCYWKSVVEDGSLNCWQLKHLAGNSMHMVSVGQLLFYCLSSLTIRLEPKPTKPEEDSKPDEAT